MTSRMSVLSLATVAALGLWAAPALADPDLDATIEDVVCPTDVDPGSITVLGVTSVLPVGVEIRGSTCENLEVGDRVKVKCADPACATAAKVEWKSKVSAEGPVATADCIDREQFTLASGVTCDVSDGAAVKMKRPRPPKGIKLPPATLTDLFDLLCAPETVLGTTAGTLEVKCEGDDVGGGVIDATKVNAKK